MLIDLKITTPIDLHSEILELLAAKLSNVTLNKLGINKTVCVLCVIILPRQTNSIIKLRHYTKETDITHYVANQIISIFIGEICKITFIFYQVSHKIIFYFSPLHPLNFTIGHHNLFCFSWEQK